MTGMEARSVPRRAARAPRSCSCAPATSPSSSRTVPARGDLDRFSHERVETRHGRAPRAPSPRGIRSCRRRSIARASFGREADGPSAGVAIPSTSPPARQARSGRENRRTRRRDRSPRAVRLVPSLATRAAGTHCARPPLSLGVFQCNNTRRRRGDRQSAGFCCRSAPPGPGKRLLETTVEQQRVAELSEISRPGRLSGVELLLVGEHLSEERLRLRSAARDASAWRSYMLRVVCGRWFPRRAGLHRIRSRSS